MGDAVNQPDMVHDASLELIEWLFSLGLTRGLDCVDVSTVLPPINPRWAERFAALDQALSPYAVNPGNLAIEQAELSTRSQYEDRSRFRLFYSLHSAVQATRERMVPRALPLAQAIPLLHRLRDTGVNVLIHQLFVEGLNDSPAEVDALIALMAREFPRQELRVLRYNHCDRSPYREWPAIDEALARLVDGHPRVKVQVSAGGEVAAACGQFLVAMPRTLRSTPVSTAKPQMPKSQTPAAGHVPAAPR